MFRLAFFYTRPRAPRTPSNLEGEYKPRLAPTAEWQAIGIYRA